jgi:acyl transferase domain-containing protein/acyl carrier protein
MADGKREYNGSEIAIVGMACRLPGVTTIDEFWRNLSGGIESLTVLTDDELVEAGVDPSVIGDPRYVRRASVLDGIEMFDPAFFGYTPLEAKVMDPQHRLFLECAWEVFEQAGYDPESYPSPVGVFTGSKTNTYLFSLFSNREFFRSLDNFQIALGNDLAAMATRVSYKLNLRGPSYALHTACSTSMVAVHLACQSLLLDECRMAVAGGAAINVPQRRGYLYQKGGILSPDGSCRTFDSQAAGSNFGNGVGAVLLKRLEDALADGDRVYAVILGSATNNDGAQKASYTAPGVDGQTRVLLEAMACSGVEAEDISYIEAHGTATDLGDSIEMLALNEAFRASTDRKGFCAVGSVKTNLGHLETAAGVAGLIKTALALDHGQLPPSLHFENPNPKIDFANSPFYVNTKLTEWPSEDGRPRRAGVSSFGIGSTNSHVVLEEPPAPVETTPPSRPMQLLVLSARTPAALDTMSANLARHLEEHPETELADAAWTLHVGRKGFQHRRTVVARDTAEAVAALRGEDGPRRHTGDRGGADHRPVVFLFPGLGEHGPDMGLDLYRAEPVFRAEIDRCAELLRPELGLDLRELLFPRGTDAPEAADSGKPDLRRLLNRGGADEASKRLAETRFAQPATFALEYALARLWMEWGVRPEAMIGYSVGEYVAACLSGVLSLEDALKLVARRARMIQELPGGAMTAVPLSEQETAPLLAPRGLSLAGLNGPAVTVVAGPEEGIAALEAELAGRGAVCRRLTTTHAFHSSMLEPAAGPLTELARTVERHEPRIPYLSNVTGTWITAAEAADPGYWARHMCSPVRFADGAAELLREGERIFLEAGPGQGLGSFVRLHPACGREAARRVVASLRAAHGGAGSLETVLAALGQLWDHGSRVDWKAFHAGEQRRRVPLPTYPFERARYWVDPVLEESGAAAGRRVTLDKQSDMADWFYRPVWQRADLPAATAGGGAVGDLWLVFRDGTGLGEKVAAELRGANREVLTVDAGEAFAAGEDGLAIRPGHPEDYVALLGEVTRRGRGLAGVVHLWTVPPLDASGEEGFARSQNLGFYSLLFLAQALGRQGLRDTVRVEVVSSGVQSVTGDEELCPEKATLLGPCKVVPQEIARVACRSIDVEVPEAGSAAEGGLAAWIVAQALAGAADESVAWRGGERWVQGFERVRMEAEAGRPARLREQGVYLLTGGLGGLGLALAEHLARTSRARLVLTGRSAFPERAAWDHWLAEHPEGDAVSAKIHKLLELESLGAEILAVAVDVADEARMREVVEAARERFGAIHGVVHLAGTPGGGIIQLKTREAADRIAAPKVRGARVLDAIFQDAELDFLMLFSSIASVLGEFGQVDYCGANAFLDAFAQRNARRGGGPPTLAVDWDIWREAGLAVYTEVPAHLRPWRQEMLEKAMLSAEGVEAFDRILRGGLPRTVVSVQELHGRIELGKSFTGESFLRELEKAQGAPARPATGGSAAAATLPEGGLERRIAEVWQRVLGLDEIGLQDNFFDMGGNSLLALQVVSEMSRDLDVQIAPVTLFESPTVSALAKHLAPPVEEETDEVRAIAERRRRVRGGERSEIALIGMTGRFPGARNVEELWENLRGGVESITFFSDEELLASGIPPATFNDPRYVRAGAVLDGIDRFDAGLFGYSPREAEVMDPQHRAFLECSWEVLERGGYDPETYPGAVGVFAGANLSTYLLRMYSDADVRESVNMLQAILGNDKDSLTTTVSYKLNLRGPSVAVQTFCSTSLVAVHMACQSLRNGESDMALAGGVRIVVPDRQGYMYETGGIAPSDGHSRSFDAKANGSVLGQGVAVVLLKRLADAVADGDPILAVIKGSSINNDGSLKAGYTAPSVAGQAEAVAAAYENAGVDPSTLGYVEAHGSATELGDPIEVTALTKAFRRWTDRAGFCPIGSVKSNFGHLDRAAGVTGLIKTVLALQHEEIPPSILFEEPNPKIDFANSPFFVNATPRPWKRGGEARRAGVNSLGMGGTNVHVVLEEPPAAEPSGPSRPWQLLVLSARTETALDTASRNLAAHLAGNPDLPLADAAWTLQVGRRGLEYRRTLVCRSAEDAAAVLEGREPGRARTAYREEGERSVVFLFSGLGGQYPGMGRGLYDSEPVFREEIDRCAGLLEPWLGLDLREVMYPAGQAAAGGEGAKKVDLKKMLRRGDAGDATEDEAARRLNRTCYAQPALFAVEYALARLWMSWGIRPHALIGYSLGEYVAACLAGTLSLEDALRLVAERARRIEELPAGAMLAVGLPGDQVLPLLGEELSLAAVNGPEQAVVSGPVEAVAALERGLEARGVSCRPLQTTHAFHSRMMDPVAEPLEELAGGITLRAPRIPYLSNVTGTWITPEEAMDPGYWSRHMCQPVRFSEGVAELLREPGRVLLEVGPGQILSSLVLQQPDAPRGGAVLGSLRHTYETQPDQAYLLDTLGKLWLLGVRVDWAAFHAGERRRRVLLPTYPFERRRYWIETSGAAAVSTRRRKESGDGSWLYAPSWRRSSSPQLPADHARESWLLLADRCGLGGALAERLRGSGAAVNVVEAGAFDPASGEAYETLLAGMADLPDRIVHLWSVTPEGESLDEEAFEQAQDLGFRSVLALARALAARGDARPPRLTVVASNLQEVSGDEELQPGKTTLLGACAAVARELPGVACRAVDVTVPAVGARRDHLVELLAAELSAEASGLLVAYRGGHRWEPVVDSIRETAARPSRLREGGAYLVTGGLEGIGALFAGFMARTVRPRLALLEPGGFPDRAAWDEWLSNDPADGRISRAIRQARAFEEAGAEVLVIAAESCDESGVLRAVATAEERFGGLHGVIYVADPAAGAGEVWEALSAGNGYVPGHARSLRVLDAALRGRALDLALLVAPPAGPRTAADAAVSQLLDAFAASRAPRWTSVTWDLPAGVDGQGAETALGRLFSLAPGQQVIVASGPLEEGWQKLAAEYAAEAPAERSEGVGFYPRPSLRVEYVVPESEVEKTIAVVWRDLLGVAEVGLHDSFLDLGGDSLLASRMMTRLREALGVELPIRLVFEAQTVAELARAVAAAQEDMQEREMLAMLEKIQGLSDEELELEISKRGEVLQEESRT